MSTPIYSEILGRHYPNPPYSWSLRGNDLSTLVFSGGPTPTQAELDALWPGVEAVLIEEAASRQKEINFQDAYPIQTQQLIIARAASTGDNTELNQMLDYWDSL